MDAQCASSVCSPEQQNTSAQACKDTNTNEMLQSAGRRMVDSSIQYVLFFLLSVMLNVHSQCSCLATHREALRQSKQTGYPCFKTATVASSLNNCSPLTPRRFFTLMQRVRAISPHVRLLWLCIHMCTFPIYPTHLHMFF